MDTRFRSRSSSVLSSRSVSSGNSSRSVYSRTHSLERKSTTPTPSSKTANDDTERRLTGEHSIKKKKKQKHFRSKSPLSVEHKRSKKEKKKHRSKKKHKRHHAHLETELSRVHKEGSGHLFEDKQVSADSEIENCDEGPKAEPAEPMEILAGSGTAVETNSTQGVPNDLLVNDGQNVEEVK